MRIYLVGFMGSGKSSVGKRLAKKLDYSFVDLDDEAERLAGKTVTEIFQLRGEEHFRKLEQQALKLSAQLQNAVIATGGGTPCYFDNMDFINANGASVYLRMSPASLVYRLEHAQKERPLVKNLSGDGLLQYIETKLKEREPYYLKAKCIIKGETIKTNQIISLIFGQCSKF